LVFRPYTQVGRTICTSASLRPSTRVSSGFGLPRHSSPSFGSQRVCSRSVPRRPRPPGRRALRPLSAREGIRGIGPPGVFNARRVPPTPFPGRLRLGAVAFAAPDHGFLHPPTRTRVRLLGPCYKTGRLVPPQSQRQILRGPLPDGRNPGEQLGHSLHPTSVARTGSIPAGDGCNKCSRPTRLGLLPPRQPALARRKRRVRRPVPRGFPGCPQDPAQDRGKPRPRTVPRELPGSEHGPVDRPLQPRPTNGSNRFPPGNFKLYLTLFSEFFSSFPHGTFSLSDSRRYLALGGTYHPSYSGCTLKRPYSPKRSHAPGGSWRRPRVPDGALTLFGASFQKDFGSPDRPP